MVRGGGTARVENHGAITLDGDLSRGILAESVAGDASVTNDGKITIVGDRTVGLRARTYEGATVASIVNSGEMTLSGAYSVGIVAYGANEFARHQQWLHNDDRPGRSGHCREG